MMTMACVAMAQNVPSENVPSFDSQRLKEMQSINYRLGLVRETCIVYLVFAAIGFLLLTLIIIQLLCYACTCCCAAKKATNDVNDATKKAEEGIDELKAESKDGRLKSRISQALAPFTKSRETSSSAARPVKSR